MCVCVCVCVRVCERERQRDRGRGREREERDNIVERAHVVHFWGFFGTPTRACSATA